MGNAGSTGLEERICNGRFQCQEERTSKGKAPIVPGDSFWSDSVFIPCGDGKARRVGSRSAEVVDGLSGGASCGGDESHIETIEILCRTFGGRSKLLRGYGNAIVPQVAAEFVRAFMEAA